MLGKAGSAEPLAQAKPAKAQPSILADLGDRSSEGVLGVGLTYDSYAQMGDYSFSLVNKLRDPVRNVYCLTVFYDKQGTPLDVQVTHYSGVIPGGLARESQARLTRA